MCHVAFLGVRLHKVLYRSHDTQPHLTSCSTSFGKSCLGALTHFIIVHCRLLFKRQPPKKVSGWKHGRAWHVHQRSLWPVLDFTSLGSEQVQKGIQAMVIIKSSNKLTAGDAFNPSFMSKNLETCPESM